MPSRVIRRRRRGVHDRLPQELARANEFTDDREMCDPLWVVRSLQQHPEVWRELDAAANVGSHLGRRRIEGSWPAIMLAFVASGHVDIEPFCNQYANSPIWQAAGFSPGADGRAIPCSVQTAWDRMTELEPFAEDFIKAANTLIRRAVAHEPRIKEAVVVDATGFETHARLEHCCPDPDASRALGGKPAKSARRANADEIAVHAGNALYKILRPRAWHCLNLPYGPAAYKLGLAPDPDPPPKPPAERART